MATAHYFLGLDGGASHCRARLRDDSGRILSEAVGPAANIYVDFAAGMAVVQEVISRALGPRRRDQVALGLGLAGLSTPDDGARATAALPGFARVEAVNDAVTACVGAHGLQDGGLIIAGTGSAGIARIGAQTTVIGGRGFLIGDDGSGARIGADALRATARALDDLQPMTELTRAIAARFDNDPLNLTLWAPQAKPGDYGAYAPLVFAAAGDGDATARAILGAAANSLAALARALVRLGAERLALVGGVAEPIRPYLPADVAARLKAPERDALDGAILLVGGAAAERSP